MSDPDRFDPSRAWDDCGDKDPDQHSPRLRSCHQRLWSYRSLAGLDDERSLVLERRGNGLIDTGLGMSFFGLDKGLYLTSDRAMPTWWRWRGTATLRKDPALMERILAANPVLDNIGGIIMWPGWQVGGPTMNQARGFGAKAKATIGDRLDLTLECIRRAYTGDFDGDRNPLGSTLSRYWEFFELFSDFDGYVKFWLLEDLVTEDAKRVKFLMEGDISSYDFSHRRPQPTSVDSYDEYLRNAQAFVLKRNDRMSAIWSGSKANATVLPN